MDAGQKRKAEEAGPDKESKQTRTGSGGAERIGSDSRKGTLRGDDFAMREKVHKLLTDTLTTGEDPNLQQIRTLAQNIETSLYDMCFGINEQYKKKAQSLKFNLSNNQELLDQVLSGTINPDDLVNMSAADLARKDLKERRVQVVEESLKEIINNEEVQALKEAAAGLTMKKTDQGLVTVEPKDLEKEKRAEEEELRKQKEREEEERRAQEAKERSEATVVKVKPENAKAYLTTWTWKPQLHDEEEEQEEKTEIDLDANIVSSPTLEDSQPDLMEGFDDPDDLDPSEKSGHIVWHGSVCPLTGQKDAFDVDAALLSGAAVHEQFPGEFVVKGSLPAAAVQDYLRSKMKDKSKVRSVYKLAPNQDGGNSAYTQFANTFAKSEKAAVLVDSKSMLLYALASTSKLGKSLVGNTQEELTLVAVALTSRTKTVKKKEQRVEDITADVSTDFRTSLGSNEKMVRLLSSVVGKTRVADCNLRVILLAGDNELARIPKELGIRGRADFDKVINYLLQQKVTVVELEPEGEVDADTYLQVVELLQEKKRAAVVLDTAGALMYLIPPVDEAGKLLDPPQDSCSNMLGVLLVNKVADEQSKAAKQEPNQETIRPQTPPSPSGDPVKAQQSSVNVSKAITSAESHRPAPISVANNSVSCPSIISPQTPAIASPGPYAHTPPNPLLGPPPSNGSLAMGGQHHNGLVAGVPGMDMRHGAQHAMAQAPAPHAMPMHPIDARAAPLLPVYQDQRQHMAPPPAHQERIPGPPMHPGQQQPMAPQPQAPYGHAHGHDQVADRGYRPSHDRGPPPQRYHQSGPHHHDGAMWDRGHGHGHSGSPRHAGGHRSPRSADSYHRGYNNDNRGPPRDWDGRRGYNEGYHDGPPPHHWQQQDHHYRR